jgi:DNA mismatch endonuclease (patch repair protein)
VAALGPVAVPNQWIPWHSEHYKLYPFCGGSSRKFSVLGYDYHLYLQQLTKRVVVWRMELLQKLVNDRAGRISEAKKEALMRKFRRKFAAYADQIRMGMMNSNSCARIMFMDTFGKRQRSEIMAKVRSTGNFSTERAMLAALRARHIRGWKLRPGNLTGSPDLYFRELRLVVFLDGCFWHGCPKCFRAPSSRKEYWRPKISRNKKRDKKVSKLLRREGYHVLRIWEHEIKKGVGIRKLLRCLA